MVSNDTISVYNNVGVDDTIVANLNISADVSTRIDHRVISNGYVFFDICGGANMHIVPNNGRLVNMGRFNACRMFVRVEMFTQNGTKRKIGIVVVY